MSVGFRESREAKRDFESLATITTDFTSNGAETFRRRFYVAEWDMVAIQGTWLATHNGTLTIWSSEAADPSTDNDNAWEQVDEIQPTGPNASSTGERIPISSVPHRWLMIKFVSSAGDGDLDFDITKKSSGV